MLLTSAGFFAGISGIVLLLHGVLSGLNMMEDGVLRTWRRPLDPDFIGFLRTAHPKMHHQIPAFAIVTRWAEQLSRLGNALAVDYGCHLND